MAHEVGFWAEGVIAKRAVRTAHGGDWPETSGVKSNMGFHDGAPGEVQNDERTSHSVCRAVSWIVPPGRFPRALPRAFHSVIEKPQRFALQAHK